MTTPYPTADVIRVDVPMLPGTRVPPLTANQRLNRWEKARRVEGVRSVVAWRVKALRVPPAEHITVTLHYQPAVKRKIDASNLMPTQKAAVDGIRDAGLVPDDDGRYVTERIPVVHPPWLSAALWIEIEPSRQHPQMFNRNAAEEIR